VKRFVKWLYRLCDRYLDKHETVSEWVDHRLIPAIKVYGHQNNGKFP
jgi:hypothetical protein